MKSLKVASPKELARRDYVLARVKINGLELQFADERLRADPEIALAAVNQCGMALAYVADALRNDAENHPEIVGRAMAKNHEAIVYVGARFRVSPEFIVRSLGHAVRQSKHAATSTNKAMKKIMTHALVTPEAWAAVAERLEAREAETTENPDAAARAKRQGTLAKIERDYQAIYTADAGLRADPVFMLRAFGHAMKQGGARSGICPILEKVIGYATVSHEDWEKTANTLGAAVTTTLPPPKPDATLWIEDLGPRGGWAVRKA